jgi:tRNA A37 N6-isopentenylltransferase MiaA
MNGFVGNTVPEHDLIRIAIVARHRKYLYPLTLRRVEQMCKQGVFKTARKLGHGTRAHWWVCPVEVINYKVSRFAIQLIDT